MTDSFESKKQQVLASVDAATRAFRKHFKREPDANEDFTFVDGYATAVRDAQDCPPVLARRTFDALPLGTRFRYPNEPQVFVKLQGHGVGLIAKWKGHEADTTTQEVFSFSDKPHELRTLEIEVVG